MQIVLQFFNDDDEPKTRMFFLLITFFAFFVKLHKSTQGSPSAGQVKSAPSQNG